MASAAQLRKIWGAAREIGLEETDLRALVERVSGSTSISALSFAQAGEVIDSLVAMGARAGTGRRRPSGRRAAKGEIKLISGPMRALISELRSQLGEKWMRDEYFAGACKRQIKQEHPRTAAEGSRVVEMLKKRIAYEEGRARDG